MKYKIGDKVAFSFKRHVEKSGSFIQFTNDIVLKANIEKIKTHHFFLFKRKSAIYKVHGIWVSEDILKPVVKKYASLRKVFSEGSKLESVWELHVS